MKESSHFIGTIGYMGGVLVVPEVFCLDYGQMIQFNTRYLEKDGGEVFYTRTPYSFHKDARNHLASQRVGDWTLMLDTDIRFKPRVAYQMVKTMEKFKIDILCAMYLYKHRPHSPVATDWNGDDYALIGDWDKRVEIFEVGSSGAGCMMVKNSVYDRIELELKEKPFSIINDLSEDLSFFERVRKLGIKSYMNPNIFVKHLWLKELDMNDYDRSAVKLGDAIEVSGVGNGKQTASV